MVLSTQIAIYLISVFVLQLLTTSNKRPRTTRISYWVILYWGKALGYCFLQGHAGIQWGGELKAVCLQLLTYENIWGSKRSASTKGFKNRLPYTVRNSLIMTAIYQKKNPKPKPSDELGYGRSEKGKHWCLFAISYCSFCLAIFFYYCQSIPTKKKTLFHGIINN